MAENSAIEWTDHTFNPWEGCQKVGPGCDHCYAETRNARFGGGTAPNWGPGAPRRRTSAANWRKPLQWQAGAAAFFAEHGRRQRVFCASLADVFDNAVPREWRADLLATIDGTPDLDWLLLTKRIGNVQDMVTACGRDRLPANVWLGATVVNQAEAFRDIPKLLATPAAMRFLSCEPLLGPLDLTRISTMIFRRAEYVDPLNGEAFGMFGDPAGRCPKIDWIIAGGESGPGARPMHPDWARSVRDQCAAAGVPFLFKQWGEWGPDTGPSEKRDRDGYQIDPVMEGRHACAVRVDDRWQYFRDGYAPPIELCSGHGEFLYRQGKKANGRLLDGVEHNGFPATRNENLAA